MLEKIEGRRTKDEMVGWHHRLNEHEFEQALGAGDGQGSLVCCSPWGHKELDMTETELNSTVVIHKVKSFSIINEAKVDVFLELSCFWYDPRDVGNLISGSSAFSKYILNIWKFSVHVLLKPNLKDFDHYLASI